MGVPIEFLLVTLGGRPVEPFAIGFPDRWSEQGGSDQLFPVAPAISGTVDIPDGCDGGSLDGMNC